jgi:hypothetical protein
MTAARRGAGAILAVLLPSAAAAGDRDWIEIRSRHFTVVSDAGEKTARETALELERMRAVFKALLPWTARAERPIRAIAARELATIQVPGRREALSFYARGPESDLMGLATDAVHLGSFGVGFGVRENRYEAAYRGYAEAALAAVLGDAVPPWYRDGVVAVFANVDIRGSAAEVGRVAPGYMLALRGEPEPPRGGMFDKPRYTMMAAESLLPVTQLVSMPQPARAQSWALAHFLMFGENGAHRPTMDRLGELLRAGRSPAEATTEALGDLAALDARYRAFVKAKKFRFQRMELGETDTKAWPARPVPAAEADAALARYREAIGATPDAPLD